MARPVWSGTLSFGLLNIPVSLMSGERRIDLHFRMLDGRTNKRIKYERVNEETGAEVPWKDIVKAFEYSKGSYVVLRPEDIKSAAPESHDSIDVDAFVDVESIAPEFFEKPYFLVPAKKAEKGYVLLRETLQKTKRAGIGRVVIRTREYLCAVMPQGNALVLNLLRYAQELVSAEDYAFPEKQASTYRITKPEMEMAEKLIDSMSREWNPKNYKDEFRARLTRVIEKRMKTKGVIKPAAEDENLSENASTNVVDFTSLLKKSLASNHRTPAKKTTTSKPVSTTIRKTPARKKLGAPPSRKHAKA